jgi:hypothetical protein
MGGNSAMVMKGWHAMCLKGFFMDNYMTNTAIQRLIYALSEENTLD